MCILSCAGSCIYLMEPFKPLRSFERLHGIVVVASEQELWCLMQFDKHMYLPGKLLTHGDATYYDSHRHVICVSDAEGVVERFEVKDLSEPHLGPHMSTIFRADEGLFVFQSASLNQPATLYEWQSDQFVKLPPGRLRDFGLESNYDQNDGNLPFSGGWRPVASVRGYDGPIEFEWNESTCRIEATSSDKIVDIVLHVRGPQVEWTATLGQFDLTKRVVE